MVWKPDVTVAAVAERDGRFLVVEERAGGRVVINQPAGHLEDGESFLEAVVRETLEETAWTFVPQA
ncbi:MAG TPA: NUDIX domain-containing protein, partial [Steroidobacteraceae bacterium]|nr:NUDIX domain-containing protein [Steroidobacteraceae bacterium]